MRPTTGNRLLGAPVTAEHAWQVTAGRVGECALFFDFDGTLAPMCDDPAAVRPVPQVMTAISALSTVVARIAVVSARPVEFLRDHFVGVPGIDLYGLYGLEYSCRGGETVTEPTAVGWVPAMAELAERARAELPDGVLVEYKRLSVALHYRTAPHLAAAVEDWGRRVADRLGLRVQFGRMVFELKPPVERDKGLVIETAARSAGCAWYFGDDVSDLRAFAALRARQRTDPDFFGICVAVANPETGHEVSEAADLTFDSPQALGDFLTTAAGTLG